MLLPAPTLILLYHRVAAPRTDLHNLCVTPDHFAAHVDHLRRHEHPVPLRDVVRRARHRRVVVTFDDGYADNASAAREILEDAGVPATVFVTSDLIGSTRDQWHDELELVLLDGVPAARHVEVVIDGQPIVVDVGSAAARTRAHWALYHRLRPLRRAAIDGVLGQLRSQIDAPPARRESHRFMTPEELRRLAASGVIDIGGHGATHQQLSMLDEREQREEILTARTRLLELTGSDVRTFAYPFGGPETFDATSVRLVEEAGYELACTGSGGPLRWKVDRFRLPRVVVKDWETTELARLLDVWFTG